MQQTLKKYSKFWLRTVEDFIEALVETQPEQARANFNRRRVVVSCLSPAIYEYVEEAETYERVIEILKQTFIKRKNNVYARHLLVSRRQSSNEFIAEYLQALKTLSKDCTFRNVTAQQYREELVRDSFINGLSSAVIQQRLLENDKLSVDRAYELADNLDRAYQHAVSLNTSQTPSAGYQAATAIPLERSTLTNQSSERFKDKSEIFTASTKKKFSANATSAAVQCTLVEQCVLLKMLYAMDVVSKVTTLKFVVRSSLTQLLRTL